jgi:hypothetical protein
VTSLEFLKQFGLRSLADLPPLAEFGNGDSESVFEQFRESGPVGSPEVRGPDDPT